MARWLVMGATMTILIIGLIVFFASHAFTMARGNRAMMIERLGEGPYKGLYSLASAIGLVLIIWGFGRYRAAGYIPVWDPPRWTRDVALVLMIPAAVLFVATYLPGEIKRRAKHPMLAALKIWALAHLLANGDLGSMLIFAAFLVYGVVDRIAVKRRGQTVAIAPGWSRNDTIAVIVGLAVYAAIVLYLHDLIIGVGVLPG
jgi:uncharacterized membrane protein